MAKVYSPPVELPAPPLTFSAGIDPYVAACEKWKEDLKAWLRAQCNHELVGEIIRFPVADGYAEYMVSGVRPLELIHLPLYDAYQIPAAHSRGLTLTEVRKQVEYQKRLDDLFKRKREGTL